jgi:hypothetical protein
VCAIQQSIHSTLSGLGSLVRGRKKEWQEQYMSASDDDDDAAAAAFLLISIIFFAKFIFFFSLSRCRCWMSMI